MVSKTLWHGWQAIASLSVYSPLFEELVKRYPGLFADGEDATQRVREMAEALERLKEEKGVARSGKRRSQSATNWKRALACVDTRMGGQALQEVCARMKRG